MTSTSTRRLRVATAYLALSASALILQTVEFMLVAIQQDFGLTASATAALTQLAAGAALLVVFAAGTLLDRFGERRVLGGASLAFCCGALVVALAPGYGFLLAGLGIAGVGYTVMTVSGIAILKEAIPDVRGRALAFGAFAVIAPVVSILSPVVTALIVPAVGWRFVPVLWVIVGATTLALVLRTPATQAEAAPRREMVTPWLAGLALAAFALMASSLVTDPWFATVLLAIALAALTVLVVLMRRIQHPTLDLRVFRQRGSLPLIAAMVVVSGVNLFLFTFMLLMYRYDLTLLDTALLLIVPQAAAAIGALLGGRVSARVGSIPTALGAVLLAAVTSLGALLISGDSPTWVAVAVLTVAAIPIAGAVGPLTQSLMDLAPVDGAGAASSLRNAAWNLGGAIGGLISAAIVLTALEAKPGSSTEAAPVVLPWARALATAHATTEADALHDMQAAAFNQAGLMCSAAYLVSAVLLGIVIARRRTSRERQPALG
ncbi:MAG: MFS transporter [bacterium]